MDSAEVKTLLFGFRGRVNRGKWWLWTVIFTVYTVGAAFGAGIVLGRSLTNVFSLDAIALAGIGFLLILYILGLIISLALSAKRLHDRNKSGWWLVLFYVVPAVLSGIGEVSGNGSINTLLKLINSAISIAMFVELGCLRGTDGPNKYGPGPFEAEEIQPAAAA